MKKVLKKLDTIQRNYENSIEAIEKELKNKFNFNFFLQYQPSDNCFMVVAYEQNASLRDCLNALEKNGFLSYYDYELLTF